MRDIDLKRVNEHLVITQGEHLEGLLDVVFFLSGELDEFLKTEKRFFGIVNSYFETINTAANNVGVQVSEEDVNMYAKILYLYRPTLSAEFRRLTRRSLSKADAVIVLVNKILTIMSDYLDEIKFSKEFKSVRKVFGNLYGNIRNPKKIDTLNNLSSLLRECIEEGRVGKFELHMLDIDLVHSSPDSYKGGETRFLESDNKEIEISF